MSDDLRPIACVRWSPTRCATAAPSSVLARWVISRIWTGASVASATAWARRKRSPLARSAFSGSFAAGNEGLRRRTGSARPRGPTAHFVGGTGGRADVGRGDPSPRAGDDEGGDGEADGEKQACPQAEEMRTGGRGFPGEQISSGARGGRRPAVEKSHSECRNLFLSSALMHAVFFSKNFRDF